MTPEMLDLARRAVACRGWRFMGGMLAVEQAVPGMVLSARPVRVDDYWHEVGVWLPDFDDPATLGCLLALAREAWANDGGVTFTITRDAFFMVEWEERLWDNFVEPRCFVYDTLAEALVAALKAAPVVTP